MTKKELLKVIDVNTVTEGEQKRLIERIKDTLSGFDNETEFGEFASVNDFVSNGGYELSVLDLKPRNIVHELDKILTEIQSYIISYRAKIDEQEQDLYDTLDNRSHKGLIAFLMVIIILAFVAIGCTIAHIALGNERFTYGDSIAEAIGTLDFVLGAIGFVWERRDDIKKKTTKRKVHKAAEKAKETGDIKEFINIVNSNIASGFFSKVVDKSKIVNNYYSQTDGN